MSPDEYIVSIKEKFGEQRSKDGILIRDMDDRELLKRMLQRYPGDREEIVGLESYLGEIPPALEPTQMQKKIADLPYFGRVAETMRGATDLVGQGFKDSVEDLGESFTRNKERGALGVPLFAGDFVGEAATGAANIALGAGKALLSPFSQIKTPEGDTIGERFAEPIKEGISGLIEKIPPEIKTFFTENEVGRQIMNLVEVSALKGVPRVGAVNPTEAIAPIVGDIKALGGAVADTGSSIVARVKNITNPTLSEKAVQDLILTRYEKGVRPSIVGKNTTGKMQAYKDDVLTAVETIKQNKANLKYADDGLDDVVEAVEGQTPKSLSQFAEAIEQTKKKVFADYDELAKIAGKGGVEVDLIPIANELDAVINSKALALTNPRAVKYAQNLQARYKKIGKLDAQTAQDVIQNYNKSLEAFYRNPSYDTASNAAIDAMIANRVRQALDEGINGLTGAQYAALKAQYGALKSIEKDVVKAAMRDARKNVKGLIDYTDILSGGQVVSGILTLNPALIASGVAQKGIAQYFKFLNDPNRAIEKMFEVSETVNPI